MADGYDFDFKYEATPRDVLPSAPLARNIPDLTASPPITFTYAIILQPGQYICIDTYTNKSLQQNLCTAVYLSICIHMYWDTLLYKGFAAICLLFKQLRN